ncbi:MAG: diguanylate cyclase [Lachnospiraceae bacterium]|nr:diguanylate cyclase [Lachnospiraceae bacterium]
MKSIRTRMIASYIITILLVFVTLSLIGAFYLVRAIDIHSSQSMELLAEHKVGELDAYFSGIERSVGILEDYLRANTDIRQFESSVNYRESMYDRLEAMSLVCARSIEHCEGVWFRANYDLYGGTEGYFLTSDGAGDFISIEPTDISLYDRNDREHVAWYYEPLDYGTPLWMDPYANKNISAYLTSYVVPVFLGSDFLGILGMDVDMTLIHKTIDDLNYDNSTAALIARDGDLLYHKDYPGGVVKEEFDAGLQAASIYFDESHADTGETYRYRKEGTWYRIVVSSLKNEMLLAISVPEVEIYGLRSRMILQMTLIFIATLIIVLLFSRHMTERIVRPIRELTEASARIARGELEQEIAYKSEDELGTLADSIRRISVELKEYIDYIHGQAYTDAMTGVRNKAAYLAEEKRLARLIREKMAEFGICVFDVNGLKRMNDTRGHEFGDMMIKDTAQVLKAVFGDRNVYRIGGDEFVVLTGQITEEEMQRQFARFEERLSLFNKNNERYEEELAVSKGFACYNPKADVDFAMVFGRADEAMYRSKAAYYELHGDRRRR